MFKQEVGASLALLSSMITPAVLILATGSLIATTSQRLGRTIDRVRKISEEFSLAGQSDPVEEMSINKERILFSMLSKSATRSKYLTWAMLMLYISLGMFIATSLAIGILGITDFQYTWLPTALGMVGSVFLFLSSAVLIVESRITYHAIADEMDYVIESWPGRKPEERKQRTLFSYLKLW